MNPSSIWKDFNPKVKQTDKRDRDAVISRGEKFVLNNANSLAIASCVAVPVCDSNRCISEVKIVYPMNSPLETFFKDKENKVFVKGFKKALEDTQMMLLEKWEELMNEGPENFDKKYCSNDVMDSRKSAPKPEKPIFDMNTEEISIFLESS